MILSHEPTSTIDMYVQAWARAATGDIEGARAMMNEALALAPGDPYAHYYDGLLKIREEELLAATEAFDVAVDRGYPVAMLAADPLLESLQGNRDFEALLHKE